jgi:hypothetical protein
MRKKAQSILEYLIILALVLGAILSSGAIEKIRSGFKAYFDRAVEKIG